MKTAVVITIKDEARLLRQNILYHLGIGVEKIFVYLDGTTDGGENTIKDIKNVEINNSVSPESYKGVQFLKKFLANANEHHTARQCLNTYDAMLKCKEQNIDWLISLDADELFLSSRDGALSLNTFFEDANKQGADIINLEPMELIARKMVYENVMQEETFFKTQKNFKSKFDQIYQKIYNPYTKATKTVTYWLGHTMGKAAVRVTENIIPKNVHRYQALDGSSLKAIDAGYLLHYHIYDFKDFIKKFQNFKEHPPVFLSGNKIEDLKSLWIKLVNDPTFSNHYLENYFKENLLYNPKKLKRLYKTRFFNILKREESAVIEIDLPKRILEKENTEKS